MNRLSRVKSFFMLFYKGADQNYGLMHLNLAFFCYIAAFSNVYSFPKDMVIQYGEIYIYLYVPTLISSTILITYPLWLNYLKNAGFISVIWYVSIFYNLIFVSTIYTILADFSPIQLMILMAGLLLTILVLSWQGAIAMICSGAILAYQFCIIYLSNLTIIGMPNAYSRIIYCLVLITAVLIAFLKPKQEDHERAEGMVDHLNHTVEEQKHQILDLSTLKQTFLRNIQHETNTPLTGVYSMSQALNDCYDKLDEEQRKNAVNTIMVNSERLISYVRNVFDVSRFISTTPNVNIRKTNFSSLVYEVLRKCKKLYIPRKAEEDREFILSIESNVIAECDEYYLRRSFENIIINAIQYCKKGIIEISLSKSRDQNQDKIIFSVKDSGIGIPAEDMSSIFEPFATSSSTTTPAGGRGLGLSLVKEVAKVHGGYVTVTSDEIIGSCFTMSLPVRLPSSGIS